MTTDATRGASEDFIDTIIDRWRGATMSSKGGIDGGDFDSMARDEFSTLSVAPQAPSVAAATEHSGAAGPGGAAARSGPLPPVEEADRGRQRTRCAGRARCSAAVAAVVSIRWCAAKQESFPKTGVRFRALSECQLRLKLR